MSRILAIGIGPLLEKGVRNFGAHALRTWHMVDPLLKAGHTVRLFTLPIMGDDPADQVKAGVEGREFETLSYSAFLNCDENFILEELNKAASEFEPDALLGINAYPCYLLARAKSRAPMWADLNGWLPAEAQIKSAVHGNNFLLGRFWEMEQKPLRRADKFSMPSMRQYYAVMGELGAFGRLNRFTYNYPFAHFIPEAYNPFFEEIGRDKIIAGSLRGKILPKDAFAVLWSGGYNAWTDADILYAGLAEAMRECPNLHYVSTGGVIYGHNNLTYERFQRLVGESEFKERFHLLGWIPAEELPGVYADCDLGVCVDSDNYETMFGARNRTINMMLAGLPVLTTVGAEISEELVAAECALGCKVGDAEEFARGLIAANWRRDQLKQLAKRGREFVLANFSYAKTTAELTAWMAQPAHAPDNSVKLARARADENPFDIATNPIEVKLAKLNAVPEPPAPIAPRQPIIYSIGRKIIGENNWNKLRYIWRTWKNESPNGAKNSYSQAEDRDSERLQELQVRFAALAGTSEAAPTMRLSEAISLGKTIPKLDCLTFLGEEIITHPESVEIIEALAAPTQARLIRLRCEGMQPIKLQTLCINLIEEGRLPGIIEVWIELEGDEVVHHAAHPGFNSWLNAHHSLELLREVREAWPGRLDFGVITTVTAANCSQVGELSERLWNHPHCRHRFELPWSRGEGVWGLEGETALRFESGQDSPAPEQMKLLLKTLRTIQRRSQWQDRAQHLALEQAVELHQRGGGSGPCVTAGRTMALIYGDGSLALCGLTRPVLKLGDYDWDFGRAWKSEAAETARAKIRSCSCIQPCYLAKNLLSTPSGRRAMIRNL